MKAKMYSFKKRVYLLSATLLLGGVFAFSAPVEFGIGNTDDPDPAIPTHGKGPVTIPSVDLDGYELTFLSSHDDYTLELRQGGVVVYSTFVSSSTSTVVLPVWLSGEYEMRLYPEDCDYYFFGYIII